MLDLKYNIMIKCLKCFIIMMKIVLYIAYSTLQKIHDKIKRNNKNYEVFKKRIDRCCLWSQPIRGSCKSLQKNDFILNLFLKSQVSNNLIT